MAKRRGTYLGGHTQFGPADHGWFGRSSESEDLDSVGRHESVSQREAKRRTFEQLDADQRATAKEGVRSRDLTVRIQLRLTQIHSEARIKRRERKVIEVKE